MFDEKDAAYKRALERFLTNYPGGRPEDDSVVYYTAVYTFSAAYFTGFYAGYEDGVQTALRNVQTAIGIKQ